ncbi:Anthranilate synthase, aminase component [Aequoribacter fuscus]|uniref:Anthranilate synthase component 1 n=2 Tax=Aequoribacter TaxID=2847769 RepID=F3L069_9GAMM|nr:anthranilate synthase component I [Aequoribacter fuscus]EGG30282.1 Anthranilate synthase, aminase component [Aequoribacter fuscus]
MLNPISQVEFQQLKAQGFKRVPVAATFLADMETPLTAYLKLARGAYSYLFESVQGGEKWGRYSIIGLPCSHRLVARGHVMQEVRGNAVLREWESSDPLAEVDAFREQFTSAPIAGLPVFHGGLVGYFAYDTVRFVEQRLAHSVPHDDVQNPDILLMVSEEVLVFDNLAGTLTLIVNVDVDQDRAYDAAIARLGALEAALPQPLEALPAIRLAPENAEAIEQGAEFSFSQDRFESAVERVKDYVLAGDVMQVVPSQRMSLPFSEPPINLYRALRNLNPSPYMYYLDLGDFYIVGSSPEILARVQDQEVTVKPMAGTRRRGRTEAEDLAMEQELKNDPKEIAEHLMLIDLGRNDVGRIAETGSVVLQDNMIIERYSHVMHIISSVTGRLKSGLSPMDVLRSTLPAGTLSGAPKVRAMEIIDELEPVKRGVYGGAVGYISWSGDMDTAIAIRTAVIKNQTLYIQAGAGIVADSVPELEWKETLNKARAMLRAAAMVKSSELLP